MADAIERQEADADDGPAGRRKTGQHREDHQQLDPQKPAKFKDPKDYTIVGKPVARLDIPAKMTGRFVYMQDFRVPGMLHGRVVRPPAMGATLESVDETLEFLRDTGTFLVSIVNARYRVTFDISTFDPHGWVARLGSK